jgi:uncharacterized membrane protein
MDASLEQRLQSLEDRLERIERLLALQPEPAPAPPPAPPSLPAERIEPPPARVTPRPPLDLEELLGGRVLAWLGGAAVVLGVVFFLVMAVSRGWIDEPTRVVLAFLGSSALLGASLWLYERKGQTQAALAAAGAALASLYASLVVATAVYDLVPDAAGLLVAALVGGAGAAIAVRWQSRVVAAIGILGALLAPVLVEAGTSGASLAFMAPALLAAVAILVWQRWPWLAFGAFLVSAPQLVGWIGEETSWFDDRHVGRVLPVIVAYWLVFLAAALAHELRVPTPRLRGSSAVLVLADVTLVSGLGWAVLDGAGHGAAATGWVLAMAVGHVAAGLTTWRGRISNEIGMLLVAVGTALSAIGFGLALDGPALVTGWAVHAALLAWVAVRAADERAMFGGTVFLALAIGHVLTVEAPPDALANGLDGAATAAAAVAVVAAAAAFMAWVSRTGTAPWPGLFAAVSATSGVYLVSVLLVDAAGASDATGATQSGQLLLSAFWSVAGLAAIVGGLLRERRPLRLGGLVLLGVTVVKVFLVDLQTLDSIYRVGSFIALGLLLIAGAFAYQRVRHEVAR